MSLVYPCTYNKYITRSTPSIFDPGGILEEFEYQYISLFISRFSKDFFFVGDIYELELAYF